MDLQKVEEFAVKVATDQATASAGALAYVGDRLGLWAALAATGPATSAELAATTGLTERYLREWLATQAAVGYVAYDEETGRYTLPAEHAAVLADDDSPAAGVGGFQSVTAFYAVADRLADAFRTGAGISWADQDRRLFSGVDRFFRPLYTRSLVAEWLPALDGMVDRLERGGRVLDVGCGYGTSAILLAQAFPGVTVHGVDPEPDSIATARAAAVKAGVADRVTFEVGTDADDAGSGYDLVTYFDAFHHLGDPVGAARRAKAALADGGALMLVEPAAHDRVADNLTLVGLVYYASSTLVCVPDALSQGATDALGGQAGPHRLHEVLAEAGFTRVRVAAEAPFNLVIEARP